MGFPRQKYWSGLPFLSPRDLSNLGIEPASPTLTGGFFTTEPETQTMVLSYSILDMLRQVMLNFMYFSSFHSSPSALLPSLPSFFLNLVILPS